MFSRVLKRALIPFMRALILFQWPQLIVISLWDLSFNIRVSRDTDMHTIVVAIDVLFSSKKNDGSFKKEV